MAASLEITDYYELLALHRALWVARFTRNPPIPYLPGSPYLANLAKRIVDTLSMMEIEQGHPERAANWHMEIDPDGELWEIIVRNASGESDSWKQRSKAEKEKIASIYLSPFTYSDEIQERFIQQVDSQTEMMDPNLPYEPPHEPTVRLIQCAYPLGIPETYYMTLLSVLTQDTSIRVLSSVIANIRGGHYSIYMNDVIAAKRFKPAAGVLKTVMDKLIKCGYEEWKAQG